MVRERKEGGSSSNDSVISIVAAGMKITGDCKTDGTIRVEGTIEGGVSAGKAVVVGRDGVINGDITTQDAVIAGTVKGTIRAESRLEVEASARIEGEIHARRMQLAEGGIVEGRVQIGEGADTPPSQRRPGGERKTPEDLPSLAASVARSSGSGTDGKTEKESSSV